MSSEKIVLCKEEFMFRESFFDIILYVFDKWRKRVKVSVNILAIS